MTLILCFILLLAVLEYNKTRRQLNEIILRLYAIECELRAPKRKVHVNNRQDASWS
jgi:hypothetical protein